MRAQWRSSSRPTKEMRRAKEGLTATQSAQSRRRTLPLWVVAYEIGTKSHKTSVPQVYKCVAFMVMGPQAEQIVLSPPRRVVGCARPAAAAGCRGEGAATTLLPELRGLSPGPRAAPPGVGSVVELRLRGSSVPSFPHHLAGRLLVFFARLVPGRRSPRAPPLRSGRRGALHCLSVDLRRPPGGILLLLQLKVSSVPSLAHPLVESG